MRNFAIITLLWGSRALGDALVAREFPTLIVPVSKLEPDTPKNTQSEFDIERDIYTEFSFDVPVNTAAYCALHFQLAPDEAPFHLWDVADNEPFEFNIFSLDPTTPINKDTDTWNHRPQPEYYVATFGVFKNRTITQEGGQWLACSKGQAAQYLAFPQNTTNIGGVTWFELKEPLHGITYEMWGPD